MDNLTKAKMLADQLPPFTGKSFKSGFYQGALIALNSENAPKTKFDWKSINTLEDALAYTGKRPEDVFKASDPVRRQALDILEFVIELIGEGYIADYTNPNQRKWFPVFNLSSGFVFSSSYYDCSRTHAGCGSRLCSENEEKSNHVGIKFQSYWMDLITK